ncbi:MAG: ABC transporter permease [Nocardioidaceae bacterium]|nr:ABC transporter permease [Nocardioidaceae bacterium]
MTVTGLETLGHGAADEAPVVDGKRIHGRSPMRIVFDRLRSDKVAVVAAAAVFVLVVLALLAPVITSLWNLCPDETCTDTAALIELGYPAVGPPYYPFTWAHPLGLEPSTGYDNTARLLYGLRTSLGVATAAAVLSTVIGVVVGLIAGFARGWLDKVISFIIDTFLSFPFILGALSLSPIIVSRFATNADALKYASVLSLIAILVIFGWMALARLIRGEVLSLREREFVQSAQVIGVPTRRILFKELLPNLVAPIVVAFSLSLPAYVAAEAGLSFLGIGITGIPSLGQTINVAYPFYSNYPLYLWAPVVTIMVLVVALNLLGDSVRDAFDPKTRR